MSSSLLAQQMINWYDQKGRTLPWRSSQKGANPYHVWLSEIMLQQTTVATVIPYFQKFIDRWSKVEDLAAASQDEVLHSWQGLGYYARARNLHKCAQVIASKYDGKFPNNEQELLKLPGVGPYTAAAIASIVFARSAPVVDGNVIRVLSRLFALDAVRPALDKIVYKKAENLTPKERPGDYAQGVMDLGATICTPRSPKCGECPWKAECQAFAKAKVLTFPKKKDKPPKPTRYGVIFVLKDQKTDEYLLEKRPEKGLLGGLVFFPTAPWREGKEREEGAWSLTEALKHAPISNVSWRLSSLPPVQHTFTHFHLELQMLEDMIFEKEGGKPLLGQTHKKKYLKGSNPKEGTIGETLFWHSSKQFKTLALPTLARKVLKAINQKI
ncbi:MAG: A/G-specific adenine glycosylase [bacterium]|nr:A/G-specific adenine glycosylase [bacterium]